MEAETLLNLYDSYWFNLDFFNRKKPSKDKNFPEIPSLPTIHTKSPSSSSSSSSSSTSSSPVGSNFSPKTKLSDHSSSASPNSVLLTPKLQTIFSGKISENFEASTSTKEAPETTVRTSTALKSASPLKGNTGTANRRKKKKGFSKSLSDLEFEELKGFIDLGFVFSEEDKDSNLANIIPGLQRLKNSSENIRLKENDIYNPTGNEYIDNTNTEGEKLMNIEKSGVSSISRPYLSEAWEVLEKKKRENYLLNWRVPPPDNQVQMKDYLRFWAHTVASTVK